MDIIEIPMLPKHRGKLQNLLNHRRRLLYWGRLQRWSALNFVMWAVYILLRYNTLGAIGDMF
jgi:hypothetical protein